MNFKIFIHFIFRFGFQRPKKNCNITIRNICFSCGIRNNGFFRDLLHCRWIHKNQFECKRIFYSFYFFCWFHSFRSSSVLFHFNFSFPFNIQLFALYFVQICSHIEILTYQKLFVYHSVFTSIYTVYFF